MFKIGGYCYNRLQNMDPNKPIPSSKNYPVYHKMTAQQKEIVRNFLLALPTEPGYPCAHRSIPIYMEDPKVSFSSMYKEYQGECDAREVPKDEVLSRTSFIRVVKYLLPTLHLGRKKVDVCNACFSLELQIKNPETSAELKQELKDLHLDEAITTRKFINKLVKSVRETVAPADAPFPQEPLYIPMCMKDKYSRIQTVSG